MGIWQQVDPAEAKSDLAGVGRKSNSSMLIELAVLSLRVTELAVIVLVGALLVWAHDGELSDAMATDHYRLAALGALIYSALAAAVGSYDADVIFSKRRPFRLMLRAWGCTGIFLVTLAFVLKASADFSRQWSLEWFFATAAGLWLVRLVFSAWLGSKKREGLFDLRTAIFGGGPQAVQLLDHLRGNDELALRLIGRFDDRSKARPASGELPPARGGLPALLKQIKNGHVDQVIVSLPWAAADRIQEVVRELALTPVRIRLAPDLAGFAFSDKPFALLGNLPVITLYDRPISGLDQSIKWLEDQILGWMLLVLLSPLFLVVAIAIKLDSPGPIFFRQPREGFNDREFAVWKFRSMRDDACEQYGITQAVKNDVRVTRVGAFLRRTSIDELPQLFNVVAGDMSLVGPRPHAASTKAGQRLFRDAVSTYAARHRVKPGITGWAQVCGWRGPTDTEEKLVRRLDSDLYYIENWSLWFDLVILARTLIAAVSSKNAY